MNISSFAPDQTKKPARTLGHRPANAPGCGRSGEWSRDQATAASLALADFFFALFVALADVAVDFLLLPLPKAWSHPSAYFLLAPTRTIVTVCSSLE